MSSQDNVNDPGSCIPLLSGILEKYQQSVLELASLVDHLHQCTSSAYRDVRRPFGPDGLQDWLLHILTDPKAAAREHPEWVLAVEKRLRERAYSSNFTNN
jgi:hypothetical protein